MVEVRGADEADRPWIRAMLDERWGGQEQVVDGDAYRPLDLPGFVATLDGDRVGYAALRVLDDGVAEIGLIEALRPRRGVGRALVAALDRAARDRGVPRLRAVTTNDNTTAQAFYAALDFHMVQVRAGAVDRSRRRKPTIPRTGDDGTPIADEWVYERSVSP